MKKIIAIIAAVALLFAFSACGKEKITDSSSESGAPTSSTPTDTGATQLLLPASAEVYDGDQLVGKYAYEWSDGGCVFTVTEGNPLPGGVLSAKYSEGKLEFYGAENKSIGMYYTFDAEGYLTKECFNNGSNSYVITYSEKRNEFSFTDENSSYGISFLVKNVPEEGYITIDSVGGPTIDRQKYTYSQYGDVTTKLQYDSTKNDYVKNGGSYEYTYDSVGNMLSMTRVTDTRTVRAKYTLSDKPMTEAWQSAMTDIAISQTYGLDSMYYLVSPMIKSK